MLQTLYFKFTGAPEAVFIFEQLGVEPWGRIALGIVELVLSILLIVPSTVWLGSALAVLLGFGAIFSHLTVLGIEVQADDGHLFIFAIIVLITSVISFWMSKHTIPRSIKSRFPGLLQ